MSAKIKSRVRPIRTEKRAPRVAPPTTGRKRLRQEKNFRSKRQPRQTKGVSYSIKTTKPPRSKVWERLMIVGIAAVLLILIGVIIYSFFLPSLFKLEENRNWLFVQTNPDSPEQDRLHLVHFNQELRRMVVVMIDPSLMVSYLGPQGEYQIRAINSLIKYENDGVLDEQKLASAYSFALQEVIDQVIVLPPAFDENGQFDPDLQLNLIKRNNIKSLLRELWQNKELEKDLHRDILKLYFFAAGNSALRLDELSDKSWSTFSNQHFSKAQQNDCSLVVVNSTSESGLANKIANLLEKEGFLVTRTGNYKKELATTTIYYNDSSEECRELVERGVKPLPFRPEIVNDPVITNQFRAGIVVVAGEDLI